MTLVDTILGGDMVLLLAATSLLHLFLHLKLSYQHLVRLYQQLNMPRQALCRD